MAWIAVVPPSPAAPTSASSQIRLAAAATGLRLLLVLEVAGQAGRGVGEHGHADPRGQQSDADEPSAGGVRPPGGGRVRGGTPT